jgi:hypothetical protein
LKLCASEPEDYEGGRTAGDIVRWAEEKAAENVPAPEVEPITGGFSNVNDIESTSVSISKLIIGKKSRRLFLLFHFLSERKQNVSVFSKIV